MLVEIATFKGVLLKVLPERVALLEKFAPYLSISKTFIKPLVQTMHGTILIQGLEVDLTSAEQKEYIR